MTILWHSLFMQNEDIFENEACHATILAYNDIGKELCKAKQHVKQNKENQNSNSSYQWPCSCFKMYECLYFYRIGNRRSPLTHLPLHPPIPPQYLFL